MKAAWNVSKINRLFLRNEQEGEQLLGETFYAALFINSPSKELQEGYYKFKEQIQGFRNGGYATYDEVYEVLDNLPKYKSQDLLTLVAVGLGLYNTIR